MEEKTIARIYEIRAAKKALEAEEKALVASLGDLEIDEHAVGPFHVKVQPNRRFNADLAAEVLADLPDHKQRKVKKWVVDSGLLKIHFPDLYPLAQKESSPKVTIDLGGE